MFGAMDVRLLHTHDNPRLGLSSALVVSRFFHAWSDVGKSLDVLRIHDTRGTVHVKPNGRLIVIEKDQADVRFSSMFPTLANTPFPLYSG